MSKPQDHWVRHEYGSDRVSEEQARAANRLPLYGVFDNIRSAHNVGSMFRSADGANAAQLLLCGYSPTPPHRHLAKTALGAVEVVPWQQYANVHEAIGALREGGVLTVAMEKTENSCSLYDIELAFPVALIMGNEATGLSVETMAACDAVAHLPMCGLKNSLNVSVAFGIALYYLMHRYQREHATKVLVNELR